MEKKKIDLKKLFILHLHFNYICVIINFYTIQKGERLFEFFSRFS